jgi:hypothetical protein
VAAAAEGLRRRIEAAGGDPGRIRIVAVTKTFSVAHARAALDAGLHDLGENYAAELVEKAAALDDPRARWHFLGAIQTNKLARLAPVTWCFQGLARAKEAEALAQRSPGSRVMVQVDVTGAEGRNGAAPEEVPSLVESARSLGLEVGGIMTVAPQDADAARRCFRRATELADELGLEERSMGMTDDLEIAVEEGSTMLRIGRALFGGRPART